MNSLDYLIKLALKEDIGRGDITTNILIAPHLHARAVIIVRQDGVIAGLSLIRQIYRVLDKRIKVRLKTKEGSKVKKGREIAIIHGPARAILTGERTVLNFLQRLSGIATLTHQFVQKVKRYRVKILDTRKTIPGWRELDKCAVCAGGGYNHRMGLYDAVLVKENHLAVLRKRGASHLKVIAEAMEVVNKRWKKRKTVEIEVRSLKEFQKALQGHPDIIMLDNMKPDKIRPAVKLRNELDPEAKLEVSGGINLNNVEVFAKTGVDFISVGALTHSPPALDISMNIFPQ